MKTFFLAAVLVVFWTQGCGKKSEKNSEAPRSNSTPVPETPLSTSSPQPQSPSDESRPAKVDVSRPEFIASKNQKIYARLSWKTGPFVSEYCSVQLEFFTPQGMPVKQIRISEIKPWMSVHGHGTSVRELKFLQDSQAHIYNVTGLWFIMSGPWDLFVTVDLGDETEQLTLPIQVP